jgi:MFS family permease
LSRFVKRNLFLIVQGQFVSLTGSSVGIIVLALWTLEVTNDPRFVGAVMFCAVLPQVLLAPLAGVLVDRSSKKRIVVATDTAMGLSMLSIAIPFLLLEWSPIQVVYWLMVVVAINGVCDAFFQPAMFAIVPSIVEKRQLDDANSLLSAANATARIIGMGLGGVLYRILGGPVVFLLDGISFLLSAISESFLRIPGDQSRHETPVNLIENLKVGFRRFWNDRGLRNAYLLFAGWNFVTATYITAFPILVTKFHGQSGAWFGYIAASIAAGSLVGLAIFKRLDSNGPRRFFLFTATIAVVGLSVTAIAFTPNSYLAVGIGFVMGAAHAPMEVMLRTVVQATVSVDIIGRVSSVALALIGISIPIGYVFWGYLLELTNQNAPLMLMISGLGIIFFLVITTMSRDYRNFMATTI